MTPEGSPADRQPSEPTFEVNTETLEKVLQPDEFLAAQVLDAAIQQAEADPQADADALALLRFQRSLVDMDPRDAFFASQAFVKQAGKYASFSPNTLPNLHYPVNRDAIIPDLANRQRWKLIGIDPSQYGDSAYANAYRVGVEESWREAIKARQNLEEAQAAEAKAMGRVAHPPVFKLPYS